MRRQFLIVPVVVALTAVTCVGARASLISDGTFDITGFGFGNHPRALTVDKTGNGGSTPVETGCIAPNGSGGLISGSGACATTFGGLNGGDGLSGGDESNPIGFPKQAAPSLNSLGITDGSQIGILFDAIQPQDKNADFVTINDLTLKLYDGTTLVFTASGTFTDLATNPGNGSSDYLFVLDATQELEFDAALGNNFTDTIALDAQISLPCIVDNSGKEKCSHGGPESFTLFNTSAPSIGDVPEPGTFTLFISALAGLGWMRRRRKAT